LGPPVETPMATILVGSRRPRKAGLAAFSLSGNTSGCTVRDLLLAAALILAIKSWAISSMCAEAASRGLATKSNAPNARALKVDIAPSVLSALTMITGTRDLLVI